MFDDIDMVRRIVAPLSRENVCITSLTQLARMLRLRDESKLRRAISRIEERVQFRLLVTEDRRLKLSERGKRFYQLVEQLFSDSEPSQLPEFETITVAVESVLAGTVLAVGLPNFFSAWGGMTALRFESFDPATIREQIQNKSVEFGLGFTESESASVERLELSASWAALFPNDHPLANAPELSEAEFAQQDRIIIPDDPRVASLLSDQWKSIPRQRQILVESRATMLDLVRSKAGVGIDLHVTGFDHRESHAVALAGLDALPIALFLPRKLSTLSEPAQSLIAAIRSATNRNTELTPATPMNKEK